MLTARKSFITLLTASVPALVLAFAATVGADGAPSTPPVQSCTLAQLTVKAGPSSVGAGNVLSEFAFVNKTSMSCSLEGYPRVQLLGSSGEPLTTSDSNAPKGAEDVPKKLVTLAKGQSAWFGVDYEDATGYANLKCPTAAKLRFTAPGVNGSVTLAGKGARIMPYGGTIPHLHCGEVTLTPVSSKALIHEGG